MKITSDLHIHTFRSLCAKPDATVAAYFAIAREMGVTTLGFADHLWDEAVPGACDWYGKQNTVHQRAGIWEEILSADPTGLTVLSGAEGEYDNTEHSAAITPGTARRLDHLLLPNSHTHIVMPKGLFEPRSAHAHYMLRALYGLLDSPVAREGLLFAIPHPFHAVCCPYSNAELYPLLSDNEFGDVFTLAAKRGVAMELNASVFAKMADPSGHPSLRMHAIARECGCRFSFGSDAHTPESMRALVCLEKITDLLGLTEQDLAPIPKARCHRE